LPYLSGMARKAQPIELSDNELRSLTTLLRRGTTSARTQTRARVLDLLHRGQHPHHIAETLSVSSATVFNINRRYQLEGLEAALFDKPRSGKPPTIDGTQRAKITALACSPAPDGHARWTLRLLADKAIQLGFVETISHNAVKQILKKTASSRTSRSNGV
jgi:putative transposase